MGYNKSCAEGEFKNLFVKGSVRDVPSLKETLKANQKSELEMECKDLEPIPLQLDKYEYSHTRNKTLGPQLLLANILSEENSMKGPKSWKTDTIRK